MESRMWSWFANSAVLPVPVSSTRAPFACVESSEYRIPSPSTGRGQGEGGESTCACVLEGFNFKLPSSTHRPVEQEASQEAHGRVRGRLQHAGRHSPGRSCPKSPRSPLPTMAAYEVRLRRGASLCGAGVRIDLP